MLADIAERVVYDDDFVVGGEELLLGARDRNRELCGSVIDSKMVVDTSSILINFFGRYLNDNLQVRHWLGKTDEHEFESRLDFRIAWIAERPN